MKRALVLLLAPLFAAAVLLTGASGTSAQTPDVSTLLEIIDSELLRAHIDAIDEPRNAFAQHARLAEAGAYVESQFETFSYAVARQDVTASGVTSQNIYAELAGTSCPERTFIVGAHYDSVADSPGADDNASGVAAMLEIARVLAGTPLPATVRFAAFTMEEDGLIGSLHMAEDLSGAGAKVVGMMSFDMLGYTAGPGNEFLAIVANTASVRLTDAVHRINERYLPEFPMAILNLQGIGAEQPDSGRSDHYPFWLADYQAFLATDTANFRNPNYHEPTDTIGTLDFEFMTNSTKAMLATTVDYVSYDGNADGEADVCSGPLAATPTVTPLATTAMPTPTEQAVMTSTPTATMMPGLPSTGFDEQVAKNDGLPWWAWPGIAVALALGAASAAIRLRD